MDLLQKKYIEEIFEEYEEGKTLLQIARKREKSVSLIKIDLLELGGEKGKEILLKELEKKTGLPVNEVIQEYTKHRSIIKLEEIFSSVSGTKIRDIIGEYETINGYKIVRKHFTEKVRKNIDIDQIIEEYRDGKTETEIGKEKQISPSAVRSIVRKYANKEGYEIYYEHDKARGKVEQNKKIQKSYEESNEKERIEELKRCNKYIIVKAIEGQSAEERKEEQNDNKEDKELKDEKIATVESIYKILKRRKYIYEEISMAAKKKGFFLPKRNYDKALEMIEESQENKKQQKGEEVEW